jgi:transposase
MSQSDLFVGIDVAKDELVVHLHPAGTRWRVANTKPGLAALGRKLTRLADVACLRIGFEASGGYERKLAILLDRLALTAYLLDPARVRSFARAERQLAKTDPLDAAVIARCLAALHGELTPYAHDPQAIRLAEHLRLRDLAVSQAVQLRNQLESIADAAMRRLINAQIVQIKIVVQRIEKAIATVIAASRELTAREALLRSAPGVGPIVAACLLARMPELGRLSSRQAAALAGLAPFERQSGKTSRPGKCSGGRPSVRRCLYLAALAITRSAKGRLAQTANKLREAGKPGKVALVAIMRKLLVTLNAMVKNNTAFSHA